MLGRKREEEGGRRREEEKERGLKSEEKVIPFVWVISGVYI